MALCSSSTVIASVKIGVSETQSRPTAAQGP